MSEPFEVKLDVTLQYNQPVEPQKVADWVQGALDHCRQEQMLSGDVNVAEEQDICCEGIRTSLSKGEDVQE